ncbi:hypothetical protein EV356DRAFT_55070 [Viridothelium virens]|uniref:Uncharacterized protein n=1 Tax=Viridothelium virens TaxID=1048519 RepID=A0A6A6GSF3_VIRVR|nr:hypothetical protein EV356DRAFT_55070 [Viridothelium virens]
MLYMNGEDLNNTRRSDFLCTTCGMFEANAAIAGALDGGCRAVALWAGGCSELEFSLVVIVIVIGLRK